MPARKTVVDMLDRFGPPPVNFRLPICAAAVADEMFVLEGAFAFFVQPALTHGDILAQGFALSLGKRRRTGQVNLASQFARVETFFSNTMTTPRLLSSRI